MIRLVQNKLIIPRGDTGTFSVPVLTPLTERDKAIFSIIDTRTNKNLLSLECNYQDDHLTIQLTHNHTVNLPIGKYNWDIKVYQDAEIIDDVIVNGIEVNSFYAAYRLPVCEIRQTGDKLLTADDTIINNEGFNLLNAALNEVRQTKTALDNYEQALAERDERISTLENTVESLSAQLNTIQNNTAEKEIFWINIIHDGTNYVLDKTWQEIFNAVLNGALARVWIQKINEDGESMLLSAAVDNIGHYENIYNIFINNTWYTTSNKHDHIIVNSLKTGG